MSTLALMQMRQVHVVAPAYPRSRSSWPGAVAPVSAGFGGGFGSPFVCVTAETNQANDIATKAHGHRRLLERPA